MADPRSASAQASVTVVGVNGAPVARGDSAATDEDTAVSGNVLDGSNGGLDTDPDDDQLVVTSTGSFTTALGGSVSLNAAGAFHYSAAGSATLQALALGQSAVDSFSYTVGDGHGGSSTAQVAITVHGRNEAPPPVAGQGVINRSVEPGTDISYYLRYINAAGAVQWLAVDSFAWDASAESSFTKGGGAAVGKPNPGQFDLVLGSSRATIDFLAKIMEGKHFADLVLEGIVMDRSGRPASVQEYLLKDAFVTSVRTSGSADSTSTSLSVVAKEISLGIAPLDAQGRAQARPFDFTWDIPAMDSSATPVSAGAQADLGHLGQSLPVDAPLDYYVRIDGIDGWFRLSGFSMGFTAETSFLKGAGAAVGKPVPDSVTMALGSSQAVTDLLAKLVKGAHGPVVEIEAYARLPGAEGRQVLVEEFFFRTVFTTSVAQSDDGHNDISFVYKSFSESHIAYKADGQVDAANSGRFGYDVGSAQVIGVPDPVADLF